MKTKDNNIRLKDCPFCGGRAILIKDSLSAQVQCVSCGSRSQVFDKDVSYCAVAEAIEAWNARV